jgi:hypothetical protein
VQQVVDDLTFFSKFRLIILQALLLQITTSITTIS